MKKDLPVFHFFDTEWKNSLAEFLLRGGRVLDVRSPIEFDEGHIPLSLNFPLLSNEQRAEIGALYKKSGKEAAITRGFQLISGPEKEKKVFSWIRAASEYQTPPLMTCFRGGLRSQISQQWLHDSGTELLRIEGGYKKVRQYFLSVLETFPEKVDFIVISGRTGSNKTKLIEHFSNSFRSIDLEKLACHRGSAFGHRDIPQPSQANYENRLALELLRCSQNINSKSLIFIEDESRMIGKITQPSVFFQKLRASPVVLIEEDVDARTNNIFEIYVQNAIWGNRGPSFSHDSILETQNRAKIEFQKFRKALISISQKLGGLETQNLLSLLEKCENDFLHDRSLERNKEWIKRLLENYYDKFYMRSLEKRNPTLLHRGPYESVRNWCETVQRSQ